jgi:hypothetical protein
MNTLSIAAALMLQVTSGPSPGALPEKVRTCDVVTHPEDYQRREFTITTDLLVDVRHRDLLNREADPTCKALLFVIVPGTQAATAYREIEDVMLGAAYARRYRRRAPMTWLYLSGIRVRVTGTMSCGSVTQSYCEMLVTELQDVVYPPGFPSEMHP